MLTHSEDGTRCVELQPLLSAFCDGQATEQNEAAIREHLRACAGCRATVRAYRATPAAAAALAPALPASRSLLERAQEFFFGLHSRLPSFGSTSDAGLTQVAAAGGTRGAGMAALAKALAICAGTVGGAAACVATGVAPAPFGIEPQDRTKASIERVSERAIEAETPQTIEDEPARAPTEAAAPPQPVEPKTEPPVPEVTAETTEAGAVEYAPPAEPAPSPPPAEQPATSSGSAAGEFGP